MDDTYHRRFWTLEEKIRSLIGSPNEKGCRIWQGRTDRYGTIKVNGKWKRVTRVLWALKHGPIPDGMFVLHTCDCPPCCEESHLFLGTLQDNVDDMVAKNRQARGHRTLDETGARRVLQLRKEGWTFKAIGYAVGISAQAACSIVHGVNWAYIQNGANR